MIEIQGLKKRLRKRWVLNGMDLTIHDGESVVVIGQSGSGKSVLLKNIIGLMRPDEGSVKIDGLEVLPPLGFNNTFAIVVRGDDARRLHLTALSQLAALAAEWRLGVGYEFIERPDGYQGLAKIYGLKFREAPRLMDLGLLYRALNDKQVDIVAGNSTDGLIAALNLTVLDDDRGYFPPYEAVPVVRIATLERVPALREALLSLAGKISDADMRRMNYAVDGERREARDVVREFLHSQGF